MSKVNSKKLKEFHNICNNPKFTYIRVVEYYPNKNIGCGGGFAISEFCEKMDVSTFIQDLKEQIKKLAQVEGTREQVDQVKKQLERIQKQIAAIRDWKDCFRATLQEIFETETICAFDFNEYYNGVNISHDVDFSKQMMERLNKY